MSKRSRQLALWKKEAICEQYGKSKGYTMDMCLARRSKEEVKKDKSRGKTTHIYCKRRAIPSTGRCPKHGGLSTGRPPVHGRYSRFVRGQLSEIFDTFKNDPNAMSMLEELAMLRTRLARILEVATDNGNFEAAKATAIVVKAIGETIEKIYKIENATLGVETIPVIINQIVNVVSENVEACPHCGRNLSTITKNIFEDLKKVRVINVKTAPGGNGNLKRIGN